MLPRLWSQHSKGLLIFLQEEILIFKQLSTQSFNNDVFIFREICKPELQNHKVAWKSCSVKITEATSNTSVYSPVKHIHKLDVLKTHQELSS